MSRPTSPARSTTSSSGASSPSIMHQQNDSEATLVNDILIMQLGKENKGTDLEEPIRQPPAPSEYHEFAEQNPFDDELPAVKPLVGPAIVCPDIPERSTSLLSSKNSGSSSRPRPVSNDSFKRYSTATSVSIRSSATSRDGPRDRYSIRPLLEEQLDMYA